MQEKNEQGRMVRKYFINCERQLHAQPITEQPIAEQPKLPHADGYADKDGRRYATDDDIGILMSVARKRALYTTMRRYEELFCRNALSETGFNARWEVAQMTFYMFDEKITHDLYHFMTVKKASPDNGVPIATFLTFLKEWQPNSGAIGNLQPFSFRNNWKN
jgi:hypothetical protein